MNKTATQLSLFQNISINPTYEIKRQIRSAVAASRLSRDEIVDVMNKISIQEGMRQTISKSTLDSWTKDSALDRLPSLPWLTIFCRTLDTVAPIAALLRPLGGDIIDSSDVMVLAWARAERDKRAASKKARLAEMALEGF